MRTCDDDGLIRHPSRPIAMLDVSLFGGPLRGDGLAWAAAATEADGTTWTYLLAIDTAADRRDITDRLPRAELGLGRDAVAVYDWRAGEILPPDDAIGASPGPREWALFVCCPIGPDGPEVGDPTEYVTVAAR